MAKEQFKNHLYRGVMSKNMILKLGHSLRLVVILLNLFVCDAFARNYIDDYESNDTSLSDLFFLILAIVLSLPIYWVIFAVLDKIDKWLPNKYYSGFSSIRRKAWLAIPFICSLLVAWPVFAGWGFYASFILIVILLFLFLALPPIDWLSSKIGIDILEVFILLSLVFGVVYAIYKFVS